MKCQNCGINEVNFHYTSNVNGCVTETHLCSRCATESGYDMGKMFYFGNIFDGMFPMISFTMQPKFGKIEQRHNCQCGCGQSPVKIANPNVEVDEEMSLRRELNAQMRTAVENEEFEKAAVLRDKIKELEAGRNKSCGTETNSQDSQSAQ